MVRFNDTLFIPVTAALLSASALFVHVITRLRKQEEQPDFELNGEDDETRRKPFSAKVKEHARAHGGAVVYLFKVLRLFGCLDLVAISVATFVLRHKGVHHLQWPEVAREHWPDVAIIGTYVRLFNVGIEIPNPHSLSDIHIYSRTRFIDKQKMEHTLYKTQRRRLACGSRRLPIQRCVALGDLYPHSNRRVGRVASLGQARSSEFYSCVHPALYSSRIRTG